MTRFSSVRNLQKNFPTMKITPTLLLMTGLCMSISELHAQASQSIVIPLSDETGQGTSHAMVEACQAGDLAQVKELLAQDADNLYATNEKGFSTFMIACVAGHDELADYLLEAGLTLNERLLTGESFIGWLAATNRTDAIEYLLSKGLDIDARDKWDNTPLLRASQWGTKAMVEFLLSKGADIKAQNQNGCTCLYFSCLAGNAELLQFFADKGQDVNHAIDNGFTPIAAAAKRGHAELIPLLIKLGADPNEKGKFDAWSTPLILACISDSPHAPAVVTALIDGGADMNLGDNLYEVPLSFALKLGHYECAEILLTRGANPNGMGKGDTPPIIGACNWFNLKAIRILAAHGADLNQTRSSNGSTALHYCSSTSFEGRAEMIALLIELGADINARNEKLRTPLISAAYSPDYDSVKLLVEAGAELNHTDQLGRSALSTAIKNKDTRTATLLIEAGADVEPLFERSGSPLTEASRLGLTEVAMMLLDRGASLDIKDSYGRTALELAQLNNRVEIAALIQLAARKERSLAPIAIPKDETSRRRYTQAMLSSCEHGNIPRCQQLIASGIAANAISHVDGRQPMHAACKGGSLELIKLLLAQGAKLDCRDAAGNTPLHALCEAGHLHLLQQLAPTEEQLKLGNASGQSLLHAACRSGKLELVQHLIDKGLDDKLLDKNGLTCLMLACGSGSIDCAKLLLERGAELDAAQVNGQSALFFAAEHAHPAITRYLLDLGADPTLIDAEGRNCLMLTLSPKKINERKEDAFTTTALLIEYGADATHCDKEGKSCLQYAQESELKRCTELMEHCQKGGSLSTLYSQEKLDSLLHYIIRTDNTELAMLLLRNGAQVNSVKDMAQTPLLHSAIDGGKMNHFLMLIELGADIHQCDKHGTSTVMAAVNYGRMEMLQYLIEAGVDPNHQTYNETALMIAASATDHPSNGGILTKTLAIKMIAYLLNHGADPTIKVKKGISMLDLVTPKTHPTISDLLKMWNG